MKLSVIILCWNDRKVIEACLESIYSKTHSTEFEVIVSDNGSTDGSIEFIRGSYPQVHVIENGRNLRFAKANNVGIRASRGEYVLILNPDTIIHDGTLDRMIGFADEHPQVGAFGCRVLNADGSYQASASPFTSFKGEWISALYLRWLGRVNGWFTSDRYPGWRGTTQRQVDWLAGCFMLVRGDVLKSIGGFDEQFFYYYEDVDLCRRIWQAGYPIVYVPDATITHLGGQSTTGRFARLPFALDSQVTRYLYYYKYYGRSGVRRARWITFASVLLRLLSLGLRQLVHPSETVRKRLEVLCGVFEWNYRVDPVRLVENGEEPSLQKQVLNRVCER
jgi:GT2 family glycosyltransferase